MARPYRWFWYLAAVIAVLVSLVPSGAAQVQPLAIGASLDQCANRLGGTSAAINDCTGGAWTSGNVNRNSSLYREGDFVPMRSIVTDLVDGRTYTYRIGYDAVEGGLHAYDYLGTYNASAFAGQQIIPCQGVAVSGAPTCNNPPSTVAVPIDTATTFPNGRGQKPGEFSMWGGTLSQTQPPVYVNPAPIVANMPPNTKVPRDVDITFTAHGDTVVLAWGAHIASTVDWGTGNTFISAGSGSSFHMRLDQIQPQGQPPVTIGGKEIGLSASVLAPQPSPFTTQVTPSSVTVGERVIDTARLSAIGSVPVTGEVRFFVCGPESTPPDCTNNGTEVLPQVVALRASRVPVNPDGTASIAFTPTEPGHYCFRAEFTPSDTAFYSPASHTNTTTECFVATLPPPRLTITKLCVPANDPGRFNLLVNGAPHGGASGTNVPCGGTTGPIQVNPGTYTVSESAGTGTNLGDYTSAIGGDCAANGSITLALGQTATCTITNLRHPPPPPATLTVHKVCSPANDPGQFEIHVTGPLVSGRSVATIACGDTVGPVELAPGSYTVSEVGVPPTDLADYTTVISGDCAANGSITLTSGQAASCTFTNTRKPLPPPLLTITKLCDPSNDPGLFNLEVDGAPLGGAAGTDVPCGGTTGPIQVTAGTHTVGESAGTGTNLGDYTSTIGGDCAANGSITLALGETATCTITNVHNAAPPPATLTVHKVCDPANDPGQFEIHVTGPGVSGRSVATVACGGTVGPIELASGSYTVSEAGVPPTDLADYTTVISGDCAANGSITLTSGQAASCTFTNTRKPPLLTITKLCDPSNDPGLFNLEVEGAPLGGAAGTDVACGGTTGPIQVTAGTHTVSESAGTGTNLGDYTTAIGGDCAANGSITLVPGQTATCTITNTRKPAPPPATLTVHKVCDPADDPGQFEINVVGPLLRGRSIATVSCGESIGPVQLAPGSYTVREAGVPPTSLADYTTVISGDCAANGSITLTAGDSATCTITNTRIPPATTLRVDKICVPAGDDGRFKLLIATAAGEPVHRVVVGCGGTTGPVHVAPGTYVVRERGAGDTHVTDYDRFIGRDCQSDGTITLTAGDEAICTIVNVRHDTPKPAGLTVTKICVPADDGGRFNLTINGLTARDVPCGGKFGPVLVPPGQQHVSESAGIGTSLADYTTTIGGACATDGTVTLAAGQLATCTITNTRAGEHTGTVEIRKQCSPAGTTGKFQIELDGQVFRSVACGESTGPVVIGVGDHQVGEVSVSNVDGRFVTTIGGDCSASGSFTLSAGQHVTCVVTNTLESPLKPPKPPPVCYTLSVARRTATVGRRITLVARVHVGPRPVPGVRVYLRGPGLFLFRTTGRNGRAVFVLRPHRRGILHFSIRKAYLCPKRPPKKIGIHAAITPPVTG